MKKENPVCTDERINTGKMTAAALKAAAEAVEGLGSSKLFAKRLEQLAEELMEYSKKQM